MDEKRVPDSVAARRDLHAWARQSTAFRHVRGNQKAIDLLEELVKKSDSPTDFLKRFNTLVSEMRGVGKEMAKRRRDGKEVHQSETRFKEDELIPLLRHPHLPLIGDVSCQQISTTAILKGFEVFLAYHHFLRYALHKDPMCFSRLSTLLQTLGGTNWFTIDKSESHPKMYGQIEEAFNEQFTLPLSRYWEKFPPFIRAIGFPSQAGKVERKTVWLGSLFPGETSDLLKLFPRTQQSYLTTWSIDIPKAWDDFALKYNGSWYMGLVPEEFLDTWRESGAAAVSHNSQCGYGMVAIDRSIYMPQRFLADYSGTLENMPKNQRDPARPAILLC